MDLVERLLSDKNLASFNLVGGTALALIIGHRKSLDIDLFSNIDFNSQALANHITASYNVSRIQTISNGVFCLIDGVKVDFLAHKYPLVERLENIEGLRMVSLKDIGAMKLNAIYNNGTRLKDFVDIYALLEIFSLQDLLEASVIKYTENNITMVKKALLHHEDIDFSVPIDYLDKTIKWPLIASRIQKAVQNPKITFDKKLFLKQNSLPKKQSINQKRKGPRL